MSDDISFTSGGTKLQDFCSARETSSVPARAGWIRSGCFQFVDILFEGGKFAGAGREIFQVERVLLCISDIHSSATITIRRQGFVHLLSYRGHPFGLISALQQTLRSQFTNRSALFWIH